MKKIVAFLLVAVLMLALVGCGEGAVTKATIELKDGTTEELTCNELEEIYRTNEAKFEKYMGAPITFIGTVSMVETNFKYNGSSDTFDSVRFKEGFVVYLLHGSYNSILEKLDKGTKLKVVSNIYNGFGGIDVRGTVDDWFAGYTSDSLKKTKLTIVE